MKFKYKLGAKAQDTITGFEGVITRRTQWLNNCNTYGLQPKGMKEDGSVKETAQFDEPALILLQEDMHQAHQRTGGPTEKVTPTNR